MKITTKYDIGQRVTVVIGAGDGWHRSYWGKTEGYIREIEIDEFGLTYIVCPGGDNDIVRLGERRIRAV